MSNLKQILARIVINASKKPEATWSRQYGYLGVKYKNGVFKYTMREAGIYYSPMSWCAGPEITREEAIAYYDKWYAKQQEKYNKK